MMMETTTSQGAVPIGFDVQDIGRDDEVRGPAHSTLTKRAPKGLPFDYVFFDWKGTLAKKSGLNSHERTDLRLQRFYEALKSLSLPRLTDDDLQSREVEIPISSCADCAQGSDAQARSERDDLTRPSADLPSLGDVKMVFDRLMQELKGEDGTQTFAWGNLLSALVRELGLDGLSDSDKQRLHTAFQVSVADSGLYRGAEEIIRWLREDVGLRLGLIRNSRLSEQAMRNRIAKAGIDPDHFESIVMGGEVGFAKPDGEVFTIAAKMADIEHIHSTDPRRILYIGNEVDADVRGANGVGWTSVLITHTEPTSNGLADYEIGHLLELKDIVQRDDSEDKEC